MDYKKIYADDPVAILECRLEDNRIGLDFDSEIPLEDTDLFKGDYKLRYENGRFFMEL